MCTDRQSMSESPVRFRCLGRLLIGTGSVLFAMVFASGHALAQDGNWAVTNGSVGAFAGWAATSGVQPLVGDFNGDGRDDIALIRLGRSWSTMPIAFANGNGGWNITNHNIGNFGGWAGTSGVRAMVGDFNGDGRDDVALIRQTSTWSTMPVAFANGNGTWNITNRGIGNFGGWAATSGVKLLVGDYNNDGRDDVALMRQTGGWTSMPIAFASSFGLGNWTITNGPVGAFAGWAATSGVRPLTGDFNGDGRDDVALIRQSSAWSTMPIALANGAGGWSITNGGIGSFGSWAATSGVTALTGDFNGDGRDDVALTRRGGSWSTMPVAFSTGIGNWTITNRNAGSFAGWAASSGVKPLTGDFNGDGRDDVALIRQNGSWISMPVAFATGNGFWNIVNGASCGFAGWARAFGAKPLTGDFNNDGRDDVALVRQAGGWSSVPTAFAAIETCSEMRITVSRHDDAELDNARADTILDDASTLLQVDNGPGDVACSVTMVRAGNVGVFNTGDGVLDTNSELQTVFSLPGNVKVVSEVNFCGGRLDTSIIGCGLTPGTSFITERFALDQEGILWAHELGHNQGLQHRNTSDNNLMHEMIHATGRRVNQGECTSFTGLPGLVGRAMATASESSDRGNMPVEDFVSRIYFHGLPLARAASYGNAEVTILLDMLQDPGTVRYHENVALTLGMIGSERAVQPLMDYVLKGTGEAKGPMSRPAYKGRVGAMVALGYLVHFSGSEEALSFLLASTSPEVWGQRDTKGLKASPTTTRELSKYAIFGLGLSGSSAAVAHLQSLNRPGVARSPDEEAFFSAQEGEINQSLEIHEQVSRDGLIQYYGRESTER